jgi:hypothetical protein
MRLGSTGLRFEADEILAEAKAEAEKILPGNGKSRGRVGRAEARLRELHADIADLEGAPGFARRRARDSDAASGRASRAAARVPPQAPAEHAEEAVLEPEAAADTEPTEVATTV